MTFHAMDPCMVDGCSRMREQMHGSQDNALEKEWRNQQSWKHMCYVVDIQNCKREKQNVWISFKQLFETIILLSNSNRFMINENRSVYYHFIRR